MWCSTCGTASYWPGEDGPICSSCSRPMEAAKAPPSPLGSAPRPAVNPVRSRAVQRTVAWLNGS